MTTKTPINFLIIFFIFSTSLVHAGLFREVTSEETAFRAAPPMSLTPGVYSGLGPLIGDNFQVDLTGYVKNEALYDTRQIVGVRDDVLLIFPEPIRRDIFGKDINNRGQSNQYSLLTAFTMELKGPKLNGATTRLFIEGDFFGRLEVFPTTLAVLGSAGFDIANTFRLLNAYYEITSDHFNFLVGQNWMPIQYPIEAPATVTAGSGTPIEGFGRNPQIRLAYYDDTINIVGMLIGAIDNVNDGPVGGSTTYQRNSMMPEIATGFRYKIDSFYTFFGGTASVRRILPRLATEKDIVTRESLTTYALTAFSKITYEPITWYTKIIWGQNMGPYYGMIGGYAVDSLDPITDQRTYTPLRTLSVWTELILQPQKNFEPALFVGYSRNLGTTKDIFPNSNVATLADRTVFGFGTDIKSVFQVIPRMRYYRLPFIFGFEYQYTRTAYGQLTCQGTIENTVPADNNRFVAAWYYIF